MSGDDAPPGEEWNLAGGVRLPLRQGCVDEDHASVH